MKIKCEGRLLKCEDCEAERQSTPPPAKTKCVLDGDHGYKGAFVDSFTQGAVPWCN